MARPTNQTASPRRYVWLVLLSLLGLVMIQAPGCSCRTETPAEVAARVAKEEAERVERERQRREEELANQPVQLPPAKMLPAGSGALSVAVKPGHWNAVQQVAKANAKDFDGTITYEVVGKTGPLVSQSERDLRLVSRRPLVVASQSTKAVDSLFYCPPTGKQPPRLRSAVRSRRTGEQMRSSTPLQQMLDHQYHFVVLAAEPQRFAFLGNMRSVNAPVEGRIDRGPLRDGTNALDPDLNYHFVGVPIDDPSGEVALPDNALAWTSIAYLLWDEVDPSVLRPAQREAIVDWINWGGQLIVVGADSLDLLRGSFLDPLLPTKSDGVRNIKRDELFRFASQWSVGRAGKPLAVGQEWTGAEIWLKGGGRWLPGANGLVAERRIGRGRIVVSALELSDSRLAGWTSGYENFTNGALLRRQPRRFVRKEQELEGKPQVAVRWADKEQPIRVDPLLNTHLRSFVRDTHSKPDDLALRLAESQDPLANGVIGIAPSGRVDSAAMTELRPAAVPGGAGAVNDFNLVGEAVRSTLGKSAGVSVPDAGFVIGCLAVYLFFLVPANWGFFAAIGRVELAWVAAPIIALLGAWVVIQQAQLDIGFVRARTEIAVLEIQPDTPRAMLTRFTALYTSLSSTYEMEFESPAVAMPFARPRTDRAPKFGATAIVAYERLEKARLRDISVSSATTEFVRSEEMLDVSEQGVSGSSLGGSIGIGKGPNGQQRLENRTLWTLEDVMIVGRPDGLKGSPQLEGCWIGDLEPGGMANIVFLPIPDQGGPQGPLPFSDERASASRLRDESADRLAIDSLMRLALDPSHYEPGERRVVARVSRVMPGLKIDPPSSQQKGATLVIGHLGYGPLPPIKPDPNSPADVQ